MEFYVFVVLFAHSLQGLLAGPPVEVTPQRIILLENRPLEVRCRARQPIAYCRFDVPGVPEGLSLRPGIPPHLGIQYLGEGLEQGECGMLIRSVSSKHSGTIVCSMGFVTEPTESKGNVTLIVARPPDPPHLKVYSGQLHKDSFKEGDVIQANCRIVNARPVANISWYLGSEPIYDRLGPTVVEEENGFMSISQNITRTVTYLDHGKDLKCVAGHIALGEGTINHSIYKLDVRFPPKPKSQELEKFGFTIGQPGKIVVTFQANPIPNIVWKVDQDNLSPGHRDRTGRFEAGILQKKGAGTWDAVLLINSVRPEEVEKRYTLIAQNDLGRESYKVAISTSPEPPADITAGTIVGIVIAILVILLLVFILIFARATGRWCFAEFAPAKAKRGVLVLAAARGADAVRLENEPEGGVPRPAGESLPSFRWFLGNKAKKNPERVSSLVYKDFILVKHEDGTKSYVSPEEKARMALEEKLKSSTLCIESEISKPAAKYSDSDSESGYEVPVARTKPKSCNDLDKSPKSEMKRHSSLPFPGGEWSPGDNGRINLPPHIIPLETSLTIPVAREKTKKKRKTQDPEVRYSSPEKFDPKMRFSLKDPIRGWENKKSSESDESPEDAEVREITEKVEGVPTEGESEGEAKADSNAEPFSEPLETTKRHSYALRFPKFPNDPIKRRSRNIKIDTNPLKKMFGRGASTHRPPEDSEPDGSGGRYSDAAPSHVESDTESADHGSADKSSMSKLTSEKQPKKLMSGLFGSFRKGRNKDKVADNDPGKNPSSFEITVKEQPDDVGQTEITRAEGIVYAELDMARSPGSVMRRDDEKTEYAEIIYPGSKLQVERPELRKSRENLTASRSNLTEVDEAFSTTPDGKKEAAV